MVGDGWLCTNQDSEEHLAWKGGLFFQFPRMDLPPCEKPWPLLCSMVRPFIVPQSSAHEKPLLQPKSGTRSMSITPRKSKSFLRLPLVGTREGAFGCQIPQKIRSPCVLTAGWGPWFLLMSEALNEDGLT